MRTETGGAPDGADPGLLRVVDAVEASFDQVVEDAVDAIWEQVPAYQASLDEELHGDVTKHVEVIYRALLTTVKEGREVRRSDFPITAEQARRRVRQGVSLSDFLHAFRVGQLTLWDGVLAASREDPLAREAALSLAGQVMHLIEVGSSVAAEAYIDAQQHQLAESDRLRRDVLEDLLAGRDISPGPKQAMVRAAGLKPGANLVVASAVPVAPLPEQHTLPEAVALVRRAVQHDVPSLTVVRQQEIVGVAPVLPGSADATVEHLRYAVAELERKGVRLALGISTIHAGLVEVPEAYTEARVARDGLGAVPGVVALPLMSTFDYLVLRDDETARRLVRPGLRRFVEEDLERGGALVVTALAYAANDLNAKAVAKQLHMHVNTAYYRLDRIAERTGCNMRCFADVLELVIGIRLLGGGHQAVREAVL